MNIENLPINQLLFFFAVVVDVFLFALGFPAASIVILTMGALGATYAITMGFMQGYILGPTVILVLSCLVVFMYWEVISSELGKFKRH